MIPLTAQTVPRVDNHPEPPRGQRSELHAAVLARGFAQLRHQVSRLAVVQNPAHAVIPRLGYYLHGNHRALEQLGDEVRGVFFELAAEFRGENHQEVRGLTHDRGAAIRDLRGEWFAQFHQLIGERVPLRGAAQQKRLDSYHGF